MQKKVWKILIRLAVLILLLGLAIGGVVRKRKALKQSEADQMPSLPVHVAVSCVGTMEVRQDYVGVAEPEQTTLVAARLTARVQEVAVREGDRVAPGTLLVRLASDDLAALVQAAEAQHRAAQAEKAVQEATIAGLGETREFLEREWQRQKNLLADGATTEQLADATKERLTDIESRLAAAEKRLESASFAVEAAAARWREARVRLEQDAVIVSSVAGVVTRRQVEPGDLMVPGRNLIEIVSDEMRLAFDVPQVESDSLEPGQALTWQADGLSGQGKVSRIHPALGASRLRRVEAAFDDLSELPQVGAYVTIGLLKEQLQDVVLVPATAIASSLTVGNYLYAVEDGCLAVRRVEILGRADGIAAVTGLAAGEQVVTGAWLGWAALAEGRPVEVMP